LGTAQGINTTTGTACAAIGRSGNRRFATVEDAAITITKAGVTCADLTSTAATTRGGILRHTGLIASAAMAQSVEILFATVGHHTIAIPISGVAGTNFTTAILANRTTVRNVAAASTGATVVDGNIGFDFAAIGGRAIAITKA